MSYDLQPRAYSKILSHSAKYFTEHCNGVLLGRRNEDDRVVVQDALPLFHTQLNLAPMLEAALIQLDVYCNENRSADTPKMSIVGYYHAYKANGSTAMDETATRIASKIQSEFKNALCLVVDNAQMNPSTVEFEPAVVAYGGTAEGKWRKLNVVLTASEGQGPACILNERARHAAATMIRSQEYEQLCDFESHLDDPRLDWFNPQFDKPSRT